MNKFLKYMTIGQRTFSIIIIIVMFTLLLFSGVAYNLVYSATDDLIETSSKEFTAQLVLNYENYINGVIDISNQIQKRLSSLNEPYNEQEIAVIFDSLIDINRNLTGVALFYDNELLSSSNIIVPNDAVPWVVQALSNEAIHHFKFSEDRMFVLKSFYKGPQLSQMMTLLIELDKPMFDRIGSNTNLGQNGHILLLDASLMPVYNVGDFDQEKSLTFIHDQILGMSLLEYDNQSMALNVSTIRATRWLLATFTNVNAINRTKTELLVAMIVIIVLMMIIVAYVSAGFSSHLNAPMRRIQNHIQKIQEGNFNDQITMTGQIEMISLAEAFNTMSAQIKTLMDNIVLEQHQKRVSTIKALQNQINPHFLYNTLDSIVHLSENNKNKDVVEAIIALSKFFRMSISNDHNIVTLKNEIEHVRNYGLIQKIRYKHSFNLQIDIDDAHMHIPVLKFCLQPLVENAIMHGIHPEMFTQIRISSRIVDNFIILEVFNEGYGLSEAKIDEIMQTLRQDLPTQSVGLKNVYQRMKLFYGQQARLVIESVMDEYTRVSLKFPIQSISEENI